MTLAPLLYVNEDVALWKQSELQKDTFEKPHLH